MIRDDVEFQQLYATSRRRWPVLLLSFLLGGILGLVSSLLLTPMYRSTASLGVGIDYSRALPLSRANEDKALLQVQNLILSDEVFEAAIGLVTDEALRREGISEVPDLRPLVRLERFDGRWDLSVTARDPGHAAELASAWAQASEQALASALEHALLVQEMQSELFEISCARVTLEETGEQVWDCSGSEVPQESSLPPRWIDEIEASRGIIPALTFSRLVGPSIPTQSARAGRPLMVVGGLVLGGIAGVLLLILGPPGALNRER